MKFSAWQSLRTSWPRLNLWQRGVVVVFFPVLFAFLTLIVWGLNTYGSHVSTEKD